jgi:predicted MFS family arabinose efflux permease
LAVFAVSLAGCNYFLFVSLQPVIFGALIDAAGVSLSGASAVLSSNMLGAIIGSLLALGAVRRIPVRKLAALGAGALTAAQLLAAALSPTASNLLMTMFGAGVGAGVLGASTLATVAAMNRPARVFSIVVAAEIVTGAAAIYLAHRILTIFGLAGVFVSMATAAAISAATTGLILEIAPGESRGVKRPAFANSTAKHPALLLFSLTVLYVSNNAAWAYLELVAKGSGLTVEEVGQALALGQFLSLWGPIAAARWEGLGTRLGIALGLTILAMATAVFTVSRGMSVTTVDTALFMGALSFVVPLYLDTLAVSDGSGRLVVWGQVAIGVGMMVGPLAGAPVAEHESLRAVMWVSALACLLSLALAWPAIRARAESVRLPAD